MINKIKCPFDDCGYEWHTRSERKYVSCASCLRKVEVQKHKVLNETKEDEEK